MAKEENLNGRNGNVARIVNRLSRDITSMFSGHSNGVLKSDLKGNQMTRPPPPQLKVLRYVVAYFSYTAVMNDELDLREGDELAVLEDVEDGWARGEIIASPAMPSTRGRIGLFPTNFVGPAKAATTTGSSIPNKKPKEYEYAKVIYEYEAANSDELSLPEGALVTVLNKNCEDDGWYEGELNGVRGLFPENFVRLLPSIPVDEPIDGTTPTNMTGIAANSFSAENYSPTSAVLQTMSEPISTSGASSMASTPAVVQPPILPAKPTSTTGGALFNAQRSSRASQARQSAPPPQQQQQQNQFEQQQPIARLRDYGTSSNRSSDTSETITAIKKAGEERKSIIAGLQSKLFGVGGAPPGGFAHAHKPILFGGATRRDESPSAKVATGESTPMAEGGDAEDSRLTALTKNRPKQVNKRPPSLNIQHQSMLPSFQPYHDATVSNSSSPGCENVTSINKPETTTTKLPKGVSQSTSTLKFSSERKSTSEELPMSTKRIVKPESSSISAAPDERKVKSQGSVIIESTTGACTFNKEKTSESRLSSSQGFVTRVEFDEFRASAYKLIEDLQRRVAELAARCENSK